MYLTVFQTSIKIVCLRILNVLFIRFFCFLAHFFFLLANAPPTYLIVCVYRLPAL